MNTIHLEPAAVPAKLRAGYAGRKFKAVVTDQPVELTQTYWGGGSRSTYTLVNLSTGQRLCATGKALNPSQFGGSQEPIRIEIPHNYAIVEHSFFCGKDHGLTFYIRPENAANLLPVPEALTPAERCVLEYTRSRKSSYAGQNRYQMHLDDWHWRGRDQEGQGQDDYPGYESTSPYSGDEPHDDPFTLEQWTAAQDTLKERKLLNKAGAITPAGRNAIGNSREYCRY